MLIQAGEDEILLADSIRLARHAAACGAPCRFEVYEKRWHVFHLSAFYLRSARFALGRLAGFASACTRAAPAPARLVAGGPT